MYVVGNFKEDFMKTKSLLFGMTVLLAASLIFMGCPDDSGETTTAVTGVTIGGGTPQFIVGTGTLTLAATVAPADATNKTVAWSSATPAAATVDTATGVVTGVAAGTTVITATTADGSKTDTVTVNVVAAGSTVRIGTTGYATLASAVAAVPTTGAEAVTIDILAAPGDTAPVVIAASSATGLLTIQDTKATKSTIPVGINVRRSKVTLDGLKLVIADKTKATTHAAGSANDLFGVFVDISSSIDNVTVNGLDVTLSTPASFTGFEVVTGIGVAGNLSNQPPNIKVTGNKITLDAGFTVNSASYSAGILAGGTWGSGSEVKNNTISGAARGIDAEPIANGTIVLATFMSGNTFASPATGYGLVTTDYFLYFYKTDPTNGDQPVVGDGVFAANFGAVDSVKANAPANVKTFVDGLTNTTVQIRKYTGSTDPREKWVVGSTAGTLTARSYLDGSTWTTVTTANVNQ
jgi:hypothetical protein